MNKNINKTVVFSHGKDGSPSGYKINILAEIAINLGFKVESVDYRTIDSPDKRVNYLIENDFQNDEEDIILVGSSMGGYVSLVSESYINPIGIFLLAPALYLDGYEVQKYGTKAKCEIVHGWNDEIISYKNSIRFAKENNFPLHLVDGDHRLNESMDEIKILFENFLKKLI